MGKKVISWTAGSAKEELSKRLRAALEYRQQFERSWEQNEYTIFNTGGSGSYADVTPTFESALDFGNDGPDDSSSDIGVNLAFKHWRFITAQMSANPPSVIARPTSADYSDRRKADAADRLIRHAMRTLKFQEVIDLASSKTILYGTGYIKTIWDTEAGQIVGMGAEEDTYEMGGDISITVPSVWDIFLDPDATCIDDVKWIFEGLTMSLEEAKFRFGDSEDILEQIARDDGASISKSLSRRNTTDNELDKVTIFEYYEKGMPLNGMVGRHCYCTRDGTVLGEVESNPFKFSAPAEKGSKKMPPVAHLPYHILTDIDVPDQAYGKSFVEYESLIQDTINRLDSVQLDNIQAHGVTRLVLAEGSEIAEDSFTNSPWDIVRHTGSQPPSFMSAPSGTPDISNFRDRLIAGANEVAGVNEAMSGQMSRETAGFAMQYAVNQGNMIRRRLFNKYVMFVEGMYKSYLSLVRKHWIDERIIQVLGREKAFETKSVKGTDIEGGFDIVVEYGTSLSLDPETRRQEITQMWPMLKEAGVDPKKVLELMKLSDISGTYDLVTLSKERQNEDFEEMIATGEYVPPEELQEHAGRLEFAYEFLETVEFKYLTDEQKTLIRDHVKDREALLAQQAPTQEAVAPALPEEAPQPGGTNQPADPMSNPK